MSLSGVVDCSPSPLLEGFTQHTSLPTSPQPAVPSLMKNLNEPTLILAQPTHPISTATDDLRNSPSSCLTCQIRPPLTLKKNCLAVFHPVLSKEIFMGLFCDTTCFFDNNNAPTPSPHKTPSDPTQSSFSFWTNDCNLKNGRRVSTFYHCKTKEPKKDGRWVLPSCTDNVIFYAVAMGGWCWDIYRNRVVHHFYSVIVLDFNLIFFPHASLICLDLLSA